MKATILVDNIKHGNLAGEWGLSVYIEYGQKKILLDAGASDLYAENAEKLGVNLAEVDVAALSHAHFDHANGLPKFLEINDHAKLYVADGCDDNCYSRYWIFGKYIGIPKGMMQQFKGRIAFADRLTEIEDGIYVMPHPIATEETRASIGKREHMYQKRNRKWTPDDFNHEQSLIFDTEDGLVIFNSCCHGGVANIIADVANAFPDKKLKAIIGGFHLYNKSAAEVRAVADRIKATGIEQVYTGHCTGDKSYEVLEGELGEMLVHLRCGLEMEF